MIPTVERRGLGLGPRRGDSVIPEVRRRLALTLDALLSQLLRLRLTPASTPVVQPITEFPQHLLCACLDRVVDCDAPTFLNDVPYLSI